ncbi:heme exporter protein CcmB [Legionella rubrilucens]|uniref:Heme exporter protein B n=1 Tax=Legionella rubrilucens TaxID=458 RepID=A0A0W0XRW1_9GAMM|nr:heme exporter protein CcmB [Legionella rubrilucens]KTD47356.1 heme exporter protein CcmB [Legionella rubrilucens]
MTTGMRLFKKQFHRELLVHLRQPRTLLHATLFFLMITVFFPLTVTPEPLLLQQLAPGLIWTAMLLSFLLASEKFFQQDYEDGVIEQWLISSQDLPVIVTAKVSVHWLLNLIPMLILCPLLAMLFSLNPSEAGVLALSLIAGTPAIIFLCALAAAFSTGLKQKGVLIALILLPFALPVMIFGSASLQAAIHGMNVSGYLALLLAFSLLAILFLPFAISAILRITLSD